jgi:succinate dehydrogenase flavin-adding protein (antitoxin of CptAB toxin-antitoxin module)
MYTKHSEFIKNVELKLLMSENLLKVLKYRCWEAGDDEPTEAVDNETLDTFRRLLKSLDKQLSEIETASSCVPQ